MMPAVVDWNVVAVIGLAAVVTYALRFGGLLLSGYLPRNGPFKAVMDALPGTILVSLVAPAVASSGPAGLLATGCTVACTLATRSVFLAMAAGMGVMVVCRHWPIWN